MPQPEKHARRPRSAALRRLSQALFLSVFLFLLFESEYRGSLRGAPGEIRLPYPVSWFLQIDPLVAASNALAARALYRGLLWSLAVLIPALFLGRFFCGWVCPLGTIHHFFSHLRSEKKRGRQGIESNRYHGWQRLKYYLLIALLMAAVLGSGLGGLLDPLSLAVRSLALSILPGINYAVNAGLDLLDGTGIRGLQLAGRGIHFVLKDTVLAFKQPYFYQGWVLGVIFIALIALNLRITRFWCRALCPLGALLGAASRWSVLGLEKEADHCGDCNRCLLHCQGGDDPLPGAPWRKAECHLCLNCVTDCPEGALRFRFFPKRASATMDGPNLQRRKALAGIAAGAALVPLARSTARGAPARPPGALDERQFLARCVRCGECMKVCPNNALQPAFAQAGLEGLWTPVLVPRLGYCEPSCVLCGQVCPTGAIWEITSKEKGWVGGGSRPVRIGTAFYDHGRCLPWSMATECIVCEEWCPTSPKAIYLRPVDVVDAQGAMKRVRQPYLDPARCVGCGACEFACPVRERPAIYVTSVGETRSRTNQILLKGNAPGGAQPLLPETGEAEGWTKTGATRTFEAANLWQYIDGDAERYIQAGVEQTFTATYRHRDGVEAVADLHRMASAVGARQVMDSQSTAGSRPVTIGDAARLYGGASLLFRDGRYFVRLVAYAEAAQPLVELARAIDRKLPRRATAGVL